MKECQNCRHWAGDERSFMAACINPNSLSGSRMPHNGSCDGWRESQDGEATFTFTVVNSTVKFDTIGIADPLQALRKWPVPTDDTDGSFKVQVDTDRGLIESKEDIETLLRLLKNRITT